VLDALSCKIVKYVVRFKALIDQLVVASTFIAMDLFKVFFNLSIRVIDLELPHCSLFKTFQFLIFFWVQQRFQTSMSTLRVLLECLVVGIVVYLDLLR
jgi:hypothetical protein